MTRIVYAKDAPAVATLPTIILINPKFPHNVGGAVRLAACFGINQVWYTGDRVSIKPEGGDRLPREERMKGYDEVELIQFDYPLDALPPDTTPVAVEVRKDSEQMHLFRHPERAAYVFGPEDGSLAKNITPLCHRFVWIPSHHCLNLYTAIGITLWDRAVKMWRYDNKEMPTLRENRGFVEIEPV